MSVIAWDGKMIAADKQATCAGLRTTVTKLRRVQAEPGQFGYGEVMAVAGDQDSGLMVMLWYEQGADPAKWPACQSDKDAWCRLLVASADGARIFERQPMSLKIEDPFYAHGSGRDYAMAAMACGKSAEEAVLIASRFDNGCGMGVDVVRFG